MTETLHVELAERSYDILIGSHLLREAGELIAPHLSIPKVFIITDENVAPHYLTPLTESLSASGIESNAIILPAGEQTKSFDVLQDVLNQILEHKPERNTTLIALGGGVIGDLTGFAASILLRGVPFIQIPTSLLSQVDSSVGGKTGINTAYGKNLVGSFYQPKQVIIDVKTLDTLSDRELRAGYAEVVKYGLIGDNAFFEWLDKHVERILARDAEALTHAICTSCKAKAAVVVADETEKGKRALLNLGHTFGHALELEAGYSEHLVHGEAVSLGMVMAFALSAHLEMSSANDTETVHTHLQKAGLPVDLAQIPIKWEADTLLSHMYADKKVSGGKLVFVLVNSIGDAIMEKNIDPDAVRVILERAIDKSL